MFNWGKTNTQYIGEICVNKGLINEEQLKEALVIQKSCDQKIGNILVELNYMTQEALIDMLAIQLKIERVHSADLVIDDGAIKKIPKDFSEKHKIFPFRLEEDKVHVVMADPTNIMAIDDIMLLTYKAVVKYIATEDEIKKLIDQYYNKISSTQAIEDLKMEYNDNNLESINILGIDDEENAPAITLVNSILAQAIEQEASDIHIEPFEHEVVVRYRIDGTLIEVMRMPKTVFGSLSARVKIISEMDIAESRKPQDGRIEIKIGGEEIHFRVSSLPTIHGEKIVLRLLDRKAYLISREKLGFSPFNNNLVSKILRYPNGILLVTGPTGSGKTTTLYAFLNEMNQPDKNIITIENPVEYMLEGINQVQVNNKAGLTFAIGLRSMLRQDPDIIMLGEIRDKETAQIAVRASVTGHFVLSTLHTNDAPSSITRLVDMGVEPYIVADALVGVIAQRLVKCLCPHCKEAYMANDEDLEIIKEEVSVPLFKAVGCKKCSNTGYKGRRAIHEIMVLNEELKSHIITGKSIEKIRKIAVENGMTTLFHDCKEVVLKGETCINELVRTVYTA